MMRGFLTTIRFYVVGNINSQMQAATHFNSFNVKYIGQILPLGVPRTFLFILFLIRNIDDEFCKYIINKNFLFIIIHFLHKHR